MEEAKVREREERDEHAKDKVTELRVKLGICHAFLPYTIT